MLKTASQEDTHLAINNPFLQNTSRSLPAVLLVAAWVGLRVHVENYSNIVSLAHAIVYRYGARKYRHSLGLRSNTAPVAEAVAVVPKGKPRVVGIDV
jgi:hypothetical protein